VTTVQYSIEQYRTVQYSTVQYLVFCAASRPGACHVAAAHPPLPCQHLLELLQLLDGREGALDGRTAGSPLQVLRQLLLLLLLLRLEVKYHACGARGKREGKYTVECQPCASCCYCWCTGRRIVHYDIREPAQEKKVPWGFWVLHLLVLLMVVHL